MTLEKELNITYSEAIARIQTIIDRLEGGSFEFEEVKVLMAEADELMHYASSKLKEAKDQIVHLTEKWDKIEGTENE